MKDITIELFDFLWKCPHNEGRGIAAGSGTDHIFKVFDSDLEKFEDLYIKAARGYSGRDDLENDELPLQCVTLKLNENGDGVGWSEGPYERQYPGYDFDGFYSAGPRVKIDCEKYLTFAVRIWYYDKFLKRVRCEDPQPFLKRSYVVCIVNDQMK